MIARILDAAECRRRRDQGPVFPPAHRAHPQDRFDRLRARAVTAGQTLIIGASLWLLITIIMLAG